jgi:hypothetical protein
LPCPRLDFSIFLIYFLIYFAKNTTFTKFIKTNLPLPWLMAVGANRHVPWRLQVLQCLAPWATTVAVRQCLTAVAHGG